MAEGTPARVVDMGLRGARLEVRRPFEPGSSIDVIIDTIPVKATVLWCQVDALNFATDHDGYLAGIAFDKASTAVDELLTDISVRGGAIRIEEMRGHDRYRITAPLTGTFGEIAPVSIVDISIAGARIAMLQRVIPAASISSASRSMTRPVRSMSRQSFSGASRRRSFASTTPA